MCARKLSSIFVLAATLLATTSAADPVRARFDYPTNELAGMTFHVFTTNNVTAPVTNWPLTVVFVETNVSPVFQIPQGITFAVCQASNSLGTSFFSNVASGVMPRNDPILTFIKP